MKALSDSVLSRVHKYTSTISVMKLYIAIVEPSFNKSALTSVVTDLIENWTMN